MRDNVREWHTFCIDEIEEARRKLTPWEKDFIYGKDDFSIGIKKRVLMGLSLTEKQEAVILKIHQRLTDCTVGAWG